jgi:RNA-directed DNA polymerase
MHGHREDGRGAWAANVTPRPRPAHPATGNAADKFRQLDRYVSWRLKRLLVKRKGRNLRAGEAERWTQDWLVGLGLHRLRGTARYPRTA